MKRGCFFSGIITITFIIGVGFYIVENYGDAIIDFGKERILQLAFNKINDKIDNLDYSQYRDSLDVMVNSFVEDLKTESFDDALDQASDFIDNINYYIKDNVIDSLEVDKIKEELYERYSKN